MGFRFYFTPLIRVLFAFPSRYLFTIGRQGVFRLAPWSARFRTGFQVSRTTQGLPRRSLVFAYRSLTFYGATFHPLLLTSDLPHRDPTTPMDKSTGLAYSLFARHYSGNRILFLFLRILRCFTSPRVASLDYEFTQE